MREIFLLQAELINAKVDMAVDRTIDRVIERFETAIDKVANQVTELRKDMDTRFIALDGRISSLDGRISSVENRLIAVETKLGLANERQVKIRDKFIDYSFKAGWLVLGAVLSYAFVHLSFLVK